jgi:hypothetical protein
MKKVGKRTLLRTVEPGQNLPDRFDEAKSLYNKAVARKIENHSLHANRYGLAFLKVDRAEMDRQVAWAAGKAGAEDNLLSNASDTEAYYGRNSKALELSRRAIDSAKHSDQKECNRRFRPLVPSMSTL